MSKIAKSSATGTGKRISRKDGAEGPSASAAPVAAKVAGNRKSLRRRYIDPTTCEREYSPEELEFMRALDQYKKTSGRMFPTCSEILEVFRSLGYVRPVSGACEPVVS